MSQKLLKGSSSTKASILKSSVIGAFQNNKKATKYGQTNTNVSTMLDRSLGGCVGGGDFNMTVNPISDSKKQLMRLMKTDRVKKHRMALVHAT